MTTRRSFMIGLLSATAAGALMRVPAIASAYPGYEIWIDDKTDAVRGRLLGGLDPRYAGIVGNKNICDNKYHTFRVRLLDGNLSLTEDD